MAGGGGRVGLVASLAARALSHAGVHGQMAGVKLQPLPNDGRLFPE